jgi:glycosyltransferase involved in cell wall biosynthesis
MRIAMLLHKSVEHDSRVRKEARALIAEGHAVTVVHLPRQHGELDGELDGFGVKSVTPPPWVRARLPFHAYRLVFLAAFVRQVRRLRPDVVHAHDAAMLVPGYLAARLTGASLVYDSHEYAAGVPYRERAWALLVTTIERVLIRRCAAVITVSDGIAERVRERYHLRERPAVVRNTCDPAAYGDNRTTIDLRAELGGDGPLVLHIGAVARDRGCSTLVAALSALDDATEVMFLGADDRAFADELLELARALGVAERVHFRGSVPIVELLACTAQGDVGVSLLEDSCENHRLALPNKVFEYLTAGLPVVASDLPELRRALTHVPAALFVDPGDPQAVARAIERAIEAPRRGQDDEVAPELTWSADAGRLIDTYGVIRALRSAQPGGA